MVERAQAGGDWRPPRADDWNAIAEATEWFQSQRALGPGGALPLSTLLTDVIKIKNSSGGARRLGDILQLSSPLITTLDSQHLWLDGVAPAEPLWTNYHGVLRQQTPETAIGDLQISGACLAYVNVTDAAHRRCTVAAAAYILQSCHAGPYQILYQPSGTGEKFCVVLMGPKRPSTGVAKLTNTLSSGSTAVTSSASAILQFRNPYTGAIESTSQVIVVRSCYARPLGIDEYVSVSQDDLGEWWINEKQAGDGETPSSTQTWKTFVAEWSAPGGGYAWTFETLADPFQAVSDLPGVTPNEDWSFPYWEVNDDDNLVCLQTGFYVCSYSVVFSDSANGGCVEAYLKSSPLESIDEDWDTTTLPLNVCEIGVPGAANFYGVMLRASSSFTKLLYAEEGDIIFLGFRHRPSDAGAASLYLRVVIGGPVTGTVIIPPPTDDELFDEIGDILLDEAGNELLME